MPLGAHGLLLLLEHRQAQRQVVAPEEIHVLDQDAPVALKPVELARRRSRRLAIAASRWSIASGELSRQFAYMAQSGGPVLQKTLLEEAAFEGLDVHVLHGLT